MLVRAVNTCRPSPPRDPSPWRHVGSLSSALLRMAPELRFWPARPLSGNTIWRARPWRLLLRRWPPTPPPLLKRTAAWRWWVFLPAGGIDVQLRQKESRSLRTPCGTRQRRGLPKYLEDGPAKGSLSTSLVVCAGGIRHDSAGGHKVFWSGGSEAQWRRCGGAARLLLSKWAHYLRGSGAVWRG